MVADGMPGIRLRDHLFSFTTIYIIVYTPVVPGRRQIMASALALQNIRWDRIEMSGIRKVLLCCGASRTKFPDPGIALSFPGRMIKQSLWSIMLGIWNARSAACA